LFTKRIVWTFFESTSHSRSNAVIIKIDFIPVGWKKMITILRFLFQVKKKNIRNIQDVMSKSGRLHMILSEAISNSVPNEESNKCVKNLGFTINKDYGCSASETSGSSSPAREKSISSGEWIERFVF
jgi:hypothetical protein